MINVNQATSLWCNYIQKTAYLSSHSFLFSTSKDCLKILRISCKVQNLLHMFMKTDKGFTVTVIWIDFLVNLLIAQQGGKLPHMNILTDLSITSSNRRTLWISKDNKLFSYPKPRKIHDHFYYTASSCSITLISSLSAAKSEKTHSLNWRQQHRTDDSNNLIYLKLALRDSHM